jgi:peptidoglycan/LPS O-acetylase OafA/YrhL
MSQGFLPRIESLRGIAALTVVSYHVCGQVSGLPSAGWIDGAAFRVLIALSNGIGAVVAFFVISGFVLSRSLSANPDPLRYFRHRLFRLFPAGVVVVALFTALHQWFGIFVAYEGDFSPVNVVLNMLMIRTDINSVMWSMKVECIATPLILFSVWLSQRSGAPWLWAIIALLFGLSFWGPYVHALGDASNLAPLYAFVVGVILQRFGEGLSRGVKPSLATIGAILSAIVFCLCGLKKQTAPILMLECLSAASLVALVAWQQTVSVFRFLDFGVVRFYGRISYSFYLLHTMGILFATRILSLAEFPPAGLPVFVGATLLAAFSILITTPAAYLSWRFIEMPFINFAKNMKEMRSVDVGAVG